MRAIPRSREVRQPYLTSIVTTLRAMAYAFVVVWQEQPDVVSSGPHACVRVCVCVCVFVCVRA